MIINSKQQTLVLCCVPSFLLRPNKLSANEPRTNEAFFNIVLFCFVQL